MQGILSSVARHKARFYYDLQGRRESSFGNAVKLRLHRKRRQRIDFGQGSFYGSATPL
jgi:hypothetical protein